MSWHKNIYAYLSYIQNIEFKYLFLHSDPVPKLVMLVDINVSLSSAAEEAVRFFSVESW